MSRNAEAVAAVEEFLAATNSVLAQNETMEPSSSEGYALRSYRPVSGTWETSYRIQDGFLLEVWGLFVLAQLALEGRHA